MDLELSGKNVVVVGGTRGLGGAVVDAFYQEGANIAFCSRNTSELESKCKSMQARAGVVFAEAVDASVHADFSDWLNRAAEFLDGVDILVWNVSAQSRDIAECLRVDIMGFDNAVKSALPFLRKSSSAAIVAMGSQAGLLALPRYKSYALGKAALISYCNSTARELAPEQIRVNVVSPGEVYDDDNIWGLLKRERPARYEEGLQKNILGRFCTPAEVAKAIVFVASPAASYITGSHLLVDGMSREFTHF